MKPVASYTQTSRKIWVTFQRAGFHHYPGAPANVAYLAARHRHLFKFKVAVSVQHNERDIEFHTLLAYLESLYDQGRLELHDRSCETIAEELATHLSSLYASRTISVEVSEDGECGSVVEIKPIED